MAKIHLDIVTAERLTYSEEVDMVIASAEEGQLGILPRHAPLMTMLVPGELRIKKAGQEESLAISGGFLEVRPDRVVILADAAERVDEIDLARAEEARRRAKEATEGVIEAI
ncbi:MAG: ATP synthase F1 subunit epsilon, partial [Chloroflexota bacterium]